MKKKIIVNNSTAVMNKTKNKFALPFKVTHGPGTNQQGASELAAVLDAVSRTTSLQDSDGKWQNRIPESGYKLALQSTEKEGWIDLCFQEALPGCGWISQANFYLEYTQLIIVRMFGKRDWDLTRSLRYSVTIDSYYRNSSISQEAFNIFIDMLLEKAAPDRGDDLVLSQFYGDGGRVNPENPLHLNAVRAALTRNPELLQFIGPKLTAAML